MDDEKCDCGSEVTVINGLQICSACGRTGGILVECKKCNKKVAIELIGKKIFGIECPHLDGIEVEVDYEEIPDYDAM